MRERDIPADYPFQLQGGSALTEWLADQGFTTDQTFMFGAPQIVNPEQLSTGDTFTTPYGELLLGRQVPKVEELFVMFHGIVKADNMLPAPHTQHRGTSGRLIIARNFAIEEPRTDNDQSPYCTKYIGLVQYGQRAIPNVIAVQSELTA